MSYPTIVHALVGLAPGRGAHARWRLLDEHVKPITDRSLNELLANARRIGALLRSQGLGPGDRVVLVYLPSIEFIEALLGALFVGVVPVAVLPPDPLGSDVDHLHHVVEDCQARALLTHRQYRRAQRFGRFGRLARLRAPAVWPGLPWIVTDASTRGDEATPLLPAPEQLAFLQYTSGSTGTPRGVRVSHSNLAHNLSLIADRAHYDANGSICWWTPQYHDLGLIAGIFTTLWVGASYSFVSPVSFLKRPACWPQMLHQYRATVTASPNFGLDLAVRKTCPEQRASWDLSALGVLGSGGEPVLGATVRRFEQAFAASGLERGVVINTYGMAEHVAAIGIGGPERVAVDPAALRAGRFEPGERGSARTFLSCGPVDGHARIRVVDPELERELPEGEIGEIWVESPSKVDGYEGVDDRSLFDAQLQTDDGHRYLRTGDLGAVHRGELYVTGRIKELIIVRGHNLYPADLEDAVTRCHPAIRPGRVAALGVPGEGGTESVAILVELREGTPEAEHSPIVQTIRATVSAEIPGGFCETVVLGTRGLILKTTSGKVRRQTCRERFSSPGYAARSEVLIVDRLSGSAQPNTPTLGSVAEAERHSVRDVILAALSGVVGRSLEDEELDHSVREFGLASVQIAELQVALEEKLGEPIPDGLLLSAPSVRSILQSLGGAARGADAAEPRLAARAWHPIELGAADPRDWLVFGEQAGELVEALQRQGTPARRLEAEQSPPPASAPAIWAPSPTMGATALLEGARRLVAQQRRATTVFAIEGADIVHAGDPTRAASAALLGFLRSVRREGLTEDWRVLDLYPSFERAAAALAVELPEIAVREGVAYRSTTKELPPNTARDEAAFGGAALLVGHASQASRRAALWLARSRGIQSLLWLTPDEAMATPLSIELERADIELRCFYGRMGEGALVERLNQAIAEQELSWAVFSAEHRGAAPASRQTRGKIDAALEAGPETLRSIVELLQPETSLLVISDASGWVGPERRAGWAAACAALRQRVSELHQEGRFARHLSVGPRRGEVDARELARLWRPMGVEPIESNEDLPLLDQLLNLETDPAALVWARSGAAPSLENDRTW